jgi:hypothetical protein
LSVTYVGARGKLLIPLIGIIAEDQSLDPGPDRGDSSREVTSPRLLATTNKADCSNTTELDQAEHGQSISYAQATSAWSREEINYYQAVVAAEEARKGSEEPNPGQNDPVNVSISQRSRVYPGFCYRYLKSSNHFVFLC